MMELKTRKIYNEDCMETMGRMDDKSVDLIVTDPPYGIEYKTNYRKNENHDFTTVIKKDDDLDWLPAFVNECFRILKENSAIYMFASPDTVDVFKRECERKFDFKNIIIWVKNNHTAGDLKAQYGKKYEMILYANKGRCELNGKRLQDVWNYPRVAGNDQEHQNQKPEPLVGRIIKKSSDKNDVVYDPFIGSGTTAVVSDKHNRRWVGNEIDDNYYEIANERIKRERDQHKMF